jgi:hypothetical protein
LASATSKGGAGGVFHHHATLCIAVKQELAELKDANPFSFKENIARVLKYFDKLLPLMQRD